MRVSLCNLCMWRLEDSLLESVLSFHPGPDSEYLYSLNHLTSPVLHLLNKNFKASLLRIITERNLLISVTFIGCLSGWLTYTSFSLSLRVFWFAELYVFDSFLVQICSSFPLWNLSFLSSPGCQCLSSSSMCGVWVSPQLLA